MNDCFCSNYLTEEDYKDMRLGKIILCPKCKHQVTVVTASLVTHRKLSMGK